MCSLQIASVEGLPGELRYPLRGLFTDAEVTLRGFGAVTAGPWLHAGALCPLTSSAFSSPGAARWCVFLWTEPHCRPPLLENERRGGNTARETAYARRCIALR